MSAKIGILIATHDHPPDLDRFFGALINQTLAPTDYEVIIVDSSRSHDYGPAFEKVLTQKDERLRLIYEPIERGGRAKAYNRGLALARAPIVLFFGDDLIATPRTAEVHLSFHHDNPDPRLVGIGSAILVEELLTRFTVWLQESGELFGVPFSEDMTSVPENFFYTGNTSVKRDLLAEAGPFDEDFKYHAWDDYELGLRLTDLGMKAVFLPEAKADHVHDISLAERSRVMVQAGESAAVFDRKYAGVQPWHDWFRVPSWRYRLHGIKSQLLYALSRDEARLIAYYRSRLARSFVAGYRSQKGPALARE